MKAYENYSKGISENHKENTRALDNKTLTLAAGSLYAAHKIPR